MNWTTPADIPARLRKRWNSGKLLQDHAAGSAFEGIAVALRGPKPREIGDDLAAARRWVQQLVEGSRAGARYRIEWSAVGGRAVGRNQLPIRAHVESWDQAWALLGVHADVARFDDLLLLAETQGAAPVRQWMAARPLRALTLADEFPQLIRAWRWLDEQRGSGRRLREVTAPGVDTKFVERHRGVLAEMLGVRSADFLAGLGLTGAPSMVRLRTHLPLPGLGTVTEVAVRVEELAKLSLVVERVVVVENLATYLSVPVPVNGAVVWGQGFDVGRLGRLPWLAGVSLDYWGDLDAKGFEILNRLRAAWPETRSLLMDEATLLAHRERWVREPKPPRGATLSHLTDEEQALYRALVEDRFGEAIRLEQEVIDWAWASERLAERR